MYKISQWEFCYNQPVEILSIPISDDARTKTCDCFSIISFKQQNPLRVFRHGFVNVLLGANEDKTTILHRDLRPNCGFKIGITNSDIP